MGRKRAKKGGTAAKYKLICFHRRELRFFLKDAQQFIDNGKHNCFARTLWEMSENGEKR